MQVLHSISSSYCMDIYLSLGSSVSASSTLHIIELLYGYLFIIGELGKCKFYTPYHRAIVWISIYHWGAR